MELKEELENINLKKLKSSPLFGASLKWSEEQKEKSIQETAEAIAKNINQSLSKNS